MPEYRVRWEINIEADTPEEAARIARDYQLDPEAIVGVFDVREWKTALRGAPAGDPVRVDLDVLDERYDCGELRLGSTRADQAARIKKD
jgi:hypothetical protein